MAFPGPPPVVVLGPTGAGKSAVALAAAQAAPGVEILAVDSMQVYRGMDIGTAKPDATERALVPHHGLDLVDPDEDFTVTRYRHAADAALVAIGDRGGRALLVAGTGLYLRALIDDLAPPGQWPDVRRELEEEPDAAALHARLQVLDPAAAARIERSNRRRLLRALEVCVGSGRPFSSFGPGLTSYPPTDVVQIGLRWSRPALARRVEVRLRRMLEGGFVEEVRALRDRPGGLSRTAAQALGYKELLVHLDGGCSLEDAVALAVTRTRQFAVRQLRWFQRDPRVRWLEMDHDVDGVHAVRELVRALT